MKHIYELKLSNLSNGESDGLVMFYMKDGKVKPIALNEDQYNMLDVTIGAIIFQPIACYSKYNVNIKNGVICDPQEV